MTSAMRMWCVLLAAAVTGCGQSVDIVQPGASPNDSELLSQRGGRPSVDSAIGSGSFGTWTTDAFGLPAYDYSMDQTTDPRAARKEIIGETSAWSQIGNDATIANAYNDGYVQLWNQARLYQWTNEYDEVGRHYAGGYGYIHEDGEVISTLWLDRPTDSKTLRRFGVGYFERRMETRGLIVEDTVTSPWGDSPALVHEITLTNTTQRQRELSWWEYWDINPVDRTLRRTIGTARPEFDPERSLLTIRQISDGIDLKPQTIFLGALNTPVDGFETTIAAFFGDGSRAVPNAVVRDTASGSIARPHPGNVTPFISEVLDGLTRVLPEPLGRLVPVVPRVDALLSGPALFALRTPVSLGPGETVTLRFVYGIADADAIDNHLAEARAQDNVRATTAAAWERWLPRVELGENWLNRELVWAAYQTRSASQWEEVCGHHIITQGGYYQYGLGFQIAFRDPLQHMLPLIYATPELARETLRYSFQQQLPISGGPVSYGMGPLCLRADIGTSNDLHFWLLLSLAEYVLATRDLDFLDEIVPFRGGLPLPAVTSPSVWDHVKLAFRFQETLTLKGPNGHYVVGATGDWADFSPQFLQMTESVLVTAQFAYVYPRLAEVAELAGDFEFAAEVRQRADELLVSLRDEWTGQGWYSRGYSGLRQIGKGAIFGEPQPWALLAGAPDAEQATTLVANIRRFLTGIGAPAQVKGPAKIGSAQSPAANDPDVTEFTFPEATDIGDNNAIFIGGVWYAINGWLVWALSELEGVVANVGDHAWDEFQRNTLTAHAEAFPDTWNGVLNVDDACWAHFTSEPDRCGVESILTLAGSTFAGQLTHQPSWTFFSLFKLAGIQPWRDGYRIKPALPQESWSLRLEHIGLERIPSGLRGYLKTEGDGPVTFDVFPQGARPDARYSVTVDGAQAKFVLLPGGGVSFTVPARAGKVFDWSVTQ